MKDVFIIIKGCCTNQFGGFRDVWQSSEEISCYYETKHSAVMHLVNNGYERDSDDVFFLTDADEDNQGIAKIVSLTKRY